MDETSAPKSASTDLAAVEPSLRPTRAAWRAGALVAAVAGLWLVFLVLAVPTNQEPTVRSTTGLATYESRAEQVVSQMDGWSFAQHALDPTMARTVEVYGGDEDIAAYRVARPVQAYVDWIAAAGGQRPLLAPAMLGLTALAIGLLPVVGSMVGAAVRRPLRWPWLVLFAPGCLASLRWPGLCDPLAAVVVLAGLAAWLGGRRTLAVVLFSVAALTRETSLLVPVGLGCAVLWEQRRIRPALPLAIPALAYAAWGLLVWVRIGTFPRGDGQVGPPFAGLIEAAVHWRPAEAVTAVLVAAACVAVWRIGHVALRFVMLVYVGFIAFLGPVVWWNWWGFGRITLPLFVLALLGPQPTTDEHDTEQVYVLADAR